MIDGYCASRGYEETSYPVNIKCIIGDRFIEMRVADAIAKRINYFENLYYQKYYSSRKVMNGS